MNRSKKLATAGVSILAAAGLSGALVANQASATAHPAKIGVVTTTPDSDTLQQGDQSSPDLTSHRVASVSRASQAPAPAKPAARPARQSAQSGSESATEPPESSGEAQSGANDGPGGHQDPPGDVQHEGGANEQ